MLMRVKSILWWMAPRRRAYEGGGLVLGGEDGRERWREGRRKGQERNGRTRTLP